MQALFYATASKHPERRLIAHSDRGSQGNRQCKQERLGYLPAAQFSQRYYANLLAA